MHGLAADGKPLGGDLPKNNDFPATIVFRPPGSVQAA